jgi:hypothetical protein
MGPTGRPEFYQDEYRRTLDGWRFRVVKITNFFVCPYQNGWAGEEIGALARTGDVLPRARRLHALLKRAAAYYGEQPNGPVPEIGDPRRMASALEALAERNWGSSSRKRGCGGRSTKGWKPT